MRKKINKKEREMVLNILAKLYPNPRTELRFTTPFQLLIATMLSAQTTDRQVNFITDGLFRKYQSPEEFAVISPAQLENEIKSCGLFKTKARNIIETSRILVKDYGSNVPDNFEELVKLPGVGRKTANVVLANAFGKDTIAVDTHVFRVANRLGLTAASTPEKTEEELLKAIPPGFRNKAHHWLIFHGRGTCRARKPKCDECQINHYCRYFKNNPL